MFNWKKKKKETDTPQKKSSSLGSKIAELFSRSSSLDDFYDELEELLIASDMGGSVTMDLVDELQKIVKKKKIKDKQGILEALRDILKGYIKVAPFDFIKDQLNFYLVLGVNGVGKTTSIAKLAHYFQKQGEDKIVLSAGDTFRAAAIDQLKIQGERTSCRVIAQSPGADPGAVMFDTLSSVKSHKDHIVLADTAGRMHNKSNLIKELQKIDKVIKQNLPEKSNYRRILVLDSTTGQNGIQQAEIFNEAIDVDYIVLTKYDGTAKGGLVVSLSRRLGLPVVFLGHGEQKEDLSLFDIDEYLDDLLAL